MDLLISACSPLHDFFMYVVFGFTIKYLKFDFPEMIFISIWIKLPASPNISELKFFLSLKIFPSQFLPSKTWKILNFQKKNLKKYLISSRRVEVEVEVHTLESNWSEKLWYRKELNDYWMRARAIKIILASRWNWFHLQYLFTFLFIFCLNISTEKPTFPN